MAMNYPTTACADECARMMRKFKRARCDVSGHLHCWDSMMMDAEVTEIKSRHARYAAAGAGVPSDGGWKFQP